MWFVKSLICSALLLSCTQNFTAPQQAMPKTPQSTKSLDIVKDKQENKTTPKETMHVAKPEFKVEPKTAVVSPTKLTTRTLKVTNNISDKSLAYKYGFISYSPSSFAVHVDGKKIEATETLPITLQDNKITMRYDYEFLGGKRKGAKEIVFEIPAHTNELSFNFSWKEDHHFIINNAKPVAIKEIY